MSHLPPAPERMSYGCVSLVFSKILKGDDSRGFVPGYHFRVINEDSLDVGHFNFRVGMTDDVRFAAKPWLFTISESILITVDPSNEASIKTIERIGACYLDEADVPKGDPHYERGSLRMARYVWRNDEPFDY